jgi:hypothetical protein
MTEHLWIEITGPDDLPERVWMCNLHPGEQERRKQWERPPTTTDEIKRLRNLLGRLEWAGQPVPGERIGTQPRCPVCRVPTPPHDRGCWLAAELRPGAPD